MDPILVPSPSKEAFNKHRPMSDLIKAQIKHFKHLEEKLSPEVRASLPQHRLITEDDAARYIEPMTKLLCAQGASTIADISAKKRNSSPKRDSDFPAPSADQTTASSKITASGSAKKSPANRNIRRDPSKETK